MPDERADCADYADDAPHKYSVPGPTPNASFVLTLTFIFGLRIAKIGTQLAETIELKISGGRSRRHKASAKVHTK